MELSPEILKMRDALLERIGDKPLKDVAQIVNEILLNETNSINRLAALSARVKVLRNYINQNYDIKKSSTKKDKFNKVMLDNEPNIKETEVNDTTKIEETESWVRVEMLKSGVVNGVRFPEGVIIDVSKNDATKLAEDNLSRIIEIEDNNDKEAPTEKKDESKTTDISLSKTESSVDKEEIKEAPTEKKDESKTTDISPSKTESSVDKEEIKEALTEKRDDLTVNKKILKKKSTKITEETIELTDPKAVAEALGLNEKKKKEEEPEEIEEEIDIEALETGKKK